MFWLIANLLIRSSIILGSGALLLRLFPRLRPTQRHLILLSTFVFLFLWPLLAAQLPQVNLTFGHPAPLNGVVTVQTLNTARLASAHPHSFVLSPIAIWAAAAFLALAPLLLAHLRLRLLLRRASPCNDAAWNHLLLELASQLGITKPPALLIHPEPLMPMAAGVLRTSIILPNACHSWSPSRRRIVLLHELAHIARRDLLSQRFARFITAAWWFQPLSWATLSLLRRESESACDELVVASGVRPSDYASELLTIAQEFSANHYAWAAGMAMARQKGLEIRVHSILQPVSPRPNQYLVTASLACLTALTVLASAVTPSSQSTSPTKGHSMKHTLFAGMLASAGLSAATIGGTIYDPSGAAVPNAKALLYNPDTNTKFETTSAADGRFAVSLPAGQYILRIESPGFAIFFREFNVKAESSADRGITLNLGKVEETVSVAAAAPSGSAVATPTPSSPDHKRIRVGGSMEEANLITKVAPTYPQSAKDARIQGTVSLDMVVSKEGEPLDIRVLSSPSDDLTQSALEAVRQWRYKPTLLNGDPVEIVTEVIVNYTLSN